MDEKQKPEIGKAVVLADVNLQPASLAVSLIMSESATPYRFHPDAGLAVIPYKNANGLWSLQTCIGLVGDNGELIEDTLTKEGVYFEGSKTQINDVVRQLVGENAAGYYFSNGADITKAQSLNELDAPEKSSFWEVPLIVTGDHRMIYPASFEKDDPGKKQGPSFDYYRQNQRKIMDNAQKDLFASLSEGKQEIMRILVRSAEGKAYPAQSVAIHQRLFYDGKKNNYVPIKKEKQNREDLQTIDAWDLWDMEPYGKRYRLTLCSLDAVRDAISLMDELFRWQAIDADPRQQALHQFNPNHYSVVCDTLSKTSPGMSRSQIFHRYLGNQSLS